MSEVSPHLAFVLDRDLGPGTTTAQALRAVGAVHGAVLIVRDGTEEVVTGPVALSPLGLDLDLEAVLVELDGQVVDSGAGAGLPGGAAAALLSGTGRRAGDVVLSGPLTGPVPASSVSVHFTRLGSIHVQPDGSSATA